MLIINLKLNQMKLVKTIQYICGFLILQFFIEALLSMGTILQFENYNIYNWVAQVVTTVFTITLSIRFANDKSNNND